MAPATVIAGRIAVLTRGPGSLSNFPAASAVVRKLPTTETSPSGPVSLDPSGVEDVSVVRPRRARLVHIPETVDQRREPDLM